MSEPIGSTDELDTELERLRAAGGTPADFERAVTDLAARLERPVTHGAVLRIARAGWTAYRGLEDVAGDELPTFQGRPWAELPVVARRTDAEGPRREQLPDESLPAYVGYLGEDLFAHLGLGEEAVATPFGRAAGGYVSVLAVPEFQSMVGWERSVDAHALGMLVAERAFQHLGESRMTDEQEDACFRWLHLATYAEVPPAHLEEVASRRAIRRWHPRTPAGAVAVMTCEVAVVQALWFHELMARAPTAALSADQLRVVIHQLAANGKDARRWAIRKDAFAEIGRLDLAATASPPGADYDAHIHGHLLRWLVEEDVPVRPHLLGWTSDYAASMYAFLVDLPARKSREVSPVLAHLRAVRLLNRRHGAVPLADELVLLAWLMDQRHIGIRLEGYLRARRKELADEARLTFMGRER